MEEGRKHIDELFREGLEGYREMPDTAVWASIEQRLPESGRRRSFLWLWILLMLALLSSMGYYAHKYWNNKPSSSIGADTPPLASANEGVVYNENDIQENERKAEQEKAAEISGAAADAISAKNKTASGKDKNSSPAEKEKVSGENALVSDKGDAEISGMEKKATADIENENRSSKENHPDPEKKQTIKQPIASTEKKAVLPVPQEDAKKQTVVTAEQPKSSAKATIPNPDKEQATTKQPIAGAEKKAALPIPQEDAKKQTAATAEQPKSSTKETHPDPDKEITANTASTANAAKKEKPAPPISIPAERTQGIPITANGEPGKAKGISPHPESAKGAPVAVENERAKGIPIHVSPEPDGETSPININAEHAQKMVLLTEPAKEYGIKINQEAEQDEEDGAENEEIESAGGGGGGGAVSNKRKNENRLKLDGGVKLGYDRGFADITTSNFTGNLFLQWNISPRTSIVLQPGIRYHAINKVSIFPQSAFHEVTSQSLDSAHVYTDSFGIQDFFVQRNYIYRNGYDSISVSYSITPQKYLEVELPLLLQYKLAENVSIFGGVQLAFGQVVQIKGGVQRYQGNKADTLSFPMAVTDDSTQMPSIPGLSGYFGYNTPTISELDENKYKNPVTNPARFAMMLGFSYEFKRRLLLDLLVRKNLSDLGFIPNEQVRRIYSQPYFRITLGYKLFQSK